jgi:hypothetical protein
MIGIAKFNLFAQSSKTLRLTMLDKFAATNVNKIPIITRAYAAIDLESLTDFDDARLIAAVFILRLLSGGRPYISRFGLFQTFHTRAYDMYVQVNVGKRLAHNLVTVLVERVFPFLAKADYSSSLTKIKKGTLVGMTISDLSFVRVVETHSVFFRWHDKVRLNFELQHADLSAANLLLSSLKASRS